MCVWYNSSCSTMSYATVQFSITPIHLTCHDRDQLRTCEYDDETLEYWVNTRTSGTMTKYKGEGQDELNFKPGVSMDGFAFSDDDDMVHTSKKHLEGDDNKSALGLHVHVTT